MGSRKGVRNKNCCSKCGATPANQRFKPAYVRDFAMYENIADMNPVDGVFCPKCHYGFVVYHLDCDWDGFLEDAIDVHGEFVPSFCPNCGEGLVE